MEIKPPLGVGALTWAAACCDVGDMGHEGPVWNPGPEVRPGPLDATALVCLPGHPPEPG